MSFVPKPRGEAESEIQTVTETPRQHAPSDASSSSRPLMDSIPPDGLSSSRPLLDSVSVVMEVSSNSRKRVPHETGMQKRPEKKSPDKKSPDENSSEKRSPNKKSAFSYGSPAQKESPSKKSAYHGSPALQAAREKFLAGKRARESEAKVANGESEVRPGAEAAEVKVEAVKTVEARSERVPLSIRRERKPRVRERKPLVSENAKRLNAESVVAEKFGAVSPTKSGTPTKSVASTSMKSVASTSIPRVSRSVVKADPVKTSEAGSSVVLPKMTSIPQTSIDPQKSLVSPSRLRSDRSSPTKFYGSPALRDAQLRFRAERGVSSQKSGNHHNVGKKRSPIKSSPIKANASPIIKITSAKANATRINAGSPSESSANMNTLSPIKKSPIKVSPTKNPPSAEKIPFYISYKRVNRKRSGLAESVHREDGKVGEGESGKAEEGESGQAEEGTECQGGNQHAKEIVESEEKEIVGREEPGEEVSRCIRRIHEGNLNDLSSVRGVVVSAGEGTDGKDDHAAKNERSERNDEAKDEANDETNEAEEFERLQQELQELLSELKGQHLHSTAEGLWSMGEGLPSTAEGDANQSNDNTIISAVILDEYYFNKSKEEDSSATILSEFLESDSDSEFSESDSDSAPEFVETDSAVADSTVAYSFPASSDSAYPSPFSLSPGQGSHSPTQPSLSPPLISESPPLAGSQQFSPPALSSQSPSSPGLVNQLTENQVTENQKTAHQETPNQDTEKGTTTSKTAGNSKTQVRKLSSISENSNTRKFAEGAHEKITKVEIASDDGNKGKNPVEVSPKVSPTIETISIDGVEGSVQRDGDSDWR